MKFPYKKEKFKKSWPDLSQVILSTNKHFKNIKLKF